MTSKRVYMLEQQHRRNRVVLQNLLDKACLYERDDDRASMFYIHGQI